MELRRVNDALATEIGYEDRNGELYDILYMLTHGEARLVIKAVENRDGIVAWQKISKKFNRKTLTRSLRMHKEVMHPKVEKDVTKLNEALMRWEEKWREMEKESG